MVNEHEKLFNKIKTFLSFIKDYNNNYLIFKLNYIEEENYSAFELSLSDNNYLSESFVLYKILEDINKNDIVTDIYIVEYYKTFVIHLLPLNKIRKNKIKKLRKRLELVA